MSLMKTLAKVAIGVAVAKGASSMIKKGADGRGQAGDGGLFGGAHSPGGAPTQSGGGIEDLLGSVLGGGGKSANQGGGLGGLLDGLSQASNPGGGASQSGGGLDGLLGGLAGKAASGGGGLGGILGAIAGATGGQGQGGGGGFGDMLNQAITKQDEPEVQPSDDQEAMAGLMLRAMIQAAKSDGKVDEAEQQKLLGRLGDVSAAEREFVQNELRSPVDIQGLARETPRQLAPQVYAMSVMGIDLDNQQEAQYLHQLAEAMGVDKQTVNHIHDQLGAPKLYS